jgi:GAF domain-containing protein
MTKEKDYFKSICNVSRVFGTTHNKRKLLHLIVDSAIHTMDGKAACLFLYDDSRQYFTAAAQKGLSEGYLQKGPTSADKVIKELGEDEYFAVYDAATDPRVDNHEEKIKEGIGSLLVVPVKVDKEIIGALSLYTSDKRKFSREDIAFLTALAEQGGMAIENTGLIDKLIRYSKLFHDLTVNINSCLDIKDILKNLSESIAKELNTKAASVRLLDEKTNRLVFAAHYGLSQAYIDSKRSQNDKGIKEALKGESVAIPDILEDPKVTYKKEKTKRGNPRHPVGSHKITRKLYWCIKALQCHPTCVYQGRNHPGCRPGLSGRTGHP